MLQAAKHFLLLPPDVTQFEQVYLERMNRIAVAFFALHLPVFVAIAYLNETGPLMAAALTLTVIAGPLMAYRYWDSQRAVSTLMGVTAMFMGGLLVHFGQGPVQIEMHFYFFVLIALLAVFANPIVIVAAAVTASLHHALLWLLLPASIFNYEAPFWVVAVHAAFVVLESVAATFIARSFFDNVVELEKKVAYRTAEVESRNRDMRTLLDSVRQGFLSIDIGAFISDERSKAVDQMLGTIAGQKTFTEVLSRHDPKAAAWFEIGLDEVFAQIMPLEVTIDQLPSRILANKRSIAIEYSPIFNVHELVGLTIVLTDITNEVERERLEAESKEMIAMMQRISADRRGFLEFIQETQSLVNDLQAKRHDNLIDLLRCVHTLKGNVSIFGLHRVAETCHVLESYLITHNESPARELWDAMYLTWEQARENLRQMVSDETSGIYLSDEAYNELIIDVLNNEPSETIVAKILKWRLEPTEVRLSRIADRATQLAAKLGKGKIRTIIDGNGLHAEPESCAAFWASLVHVVRNAVDHGIETPEERLARGKSEFGTLTLKTFCDETRFHISIADDGRGIHWEKIRDLAKKLGMPHHTHDDLVDALFADGLSTAGSVTSTSGRGVGMAAVRASCLKMQGEISIDSEWGQRTEFCFSFPIENMSPQTNQLLSSYTFLQPISILSQIAFAK